MTTANRWQDQCEAARSIAEQFGTTKAMEYLVGEKFLNFLRAIESHTDLRRELPTFSAEIREIFGSQELGEYLGKLSGPARFDANDYDEDDEPSDLEDARQENVRRVAEELLLLEQAKDWLLVQ